MTRRPLTPHTGSRRWILPTLIAAVAILALSAVTWAAPAAAPFQQGEKLVYRALWGRVPAGDAVIEVLPFKVHNGIRLYHFAMTTRTSPLVDRLYKVRERQDSYPDERLTHTVLYMKKNTGAHPRDVVVTYDRQRMTATYASFGQAEKPVPIQAGTFDPLALFFVIRLHTFHSGDVLEIPVSDGKKWIRTRATVAGRENVTIGGRIYDTYLVIPDMERLDGVVKDGEEPQLKIWFTADERKLPVRIESRAGAGRFVFELVSASF